MNRPSHSAKLAALVAVFLICAQAAWAWQPAATNQTTAHQIVFQPPVEGTCRTESGSVSRGRLVSISELEIVMINAQNRQVNFPMEGIRIIRTKDGEFQYEPENDDFSDAVRRASELDGVRIVDIYVPQPNQPGVGQGNPGNGRPTTSGVPNRPPAGADSPPTSTQTDAGTGNAPTYSSTPGFSNGPPSRTSNTPATVDVGDSTQRCASCGNLIPADSRPGQTCPHCGVLWVANPVRQATTIDTTHTHSGDSSTPVAGRGPAPAAGQTPPPQPATVPPPLVGQGGSFSFETMPMWQKAGAFLGFLAVLYLVANNRR